MNAPSTGPRWPTANGPRPVVLMLAVIGWSWAWWGVALWSGGAWLAYPTIVFTLLGMLGPLVVTASFVAAGAWDQPARRFWRDALDPRRAPARAHALALVLVAVLAGVPVLVRALLDGVAPWQAIDGSGAGAFLVVGALAGVVEEPAWRGYAQRALQRRVTVLAAALVVGVAWAVWHLPLFLIEGTYQSSLGLGTEAFWAFTLALLAGSVVYAWLLGSSGGAPVIAVVFHAVSNVVRELWAVDGMQRVELVVELGVALVVVALAWSWLCRPWPASGGAAKVPQPGFRSR